MEKKQRTVALRNFLRNMKSLIDMLETESPEELVLPQYQKFQACWEKLEAAQDAFLTVTELDVETDPNGFAYIDEPTEQYRNVVLLYSNYLKKQKEAEKTELNQKLAEDRESSEQHRLRMEAEKKAAEAELAKEQLKARFDSAKAELVAGIEAFKRMNLSLKDCVVEASSADKRREWSKVEAEFHSLKSQMVKVAGIDSSQDVSDVNERFAEDAEAPYLESQKWMLCELKTEAVTSFEASADGICKTKREAVQLPSFKGSERDSPFLEFPTWLSQWNNLIVDYEEKVRARLLYEHVDVAAREKFCGFDRNYDEAMKRLEYYYGNPVKVVRCVMEEVTSPKIVAEGDYKSLLLYSSVIERNYNRLISMELEHEMSNSTTMAVILRKFPRSVMEKWAEFLAAQSNRDKAKPFPLLVKWLISMKEIWERMIFVNNSKGSKDQHGSFFGDSSRRQLTCHRCGQEGHVRRDCPRKSDHQDRGDRGSPKVKKYWCALHQDDSSRKCSSESCQDLRKMSDVTRRIQLLKDNGDCLHCCGDHRAADCRKQDRVCGNGKVNRGCSQQHKMHELFCPAAKCFSIQQVYSAGDSESEDGVVLLIMLVKNQRRGQYSSVFWDLGCTSNFVREQHAKQCGFKGTLKQLSVTTLGGVTTDMSVMLYTCFLREVDGTLQKFEAYGMESITGALTHLESGIVKKTFPHLDEHTISQLRRADQVDFLIGIKHTSWHPERAERAKDGDFWVYRGRFGVCVGGRHPSINEQTRRSDSLFSVVHYVYHAKVNHSQEFTPHELEFCPKRTVAYDESISRFAEDITDCVKSTSTALNGKKANPALFSSNAECFATKTAPINPDEMFFQLESLGTMIEPKCGSCACSKCPVPGSKYCFTQQKELDRIMNNLVYDESLKRWITPLPWKFPRSDLPKNEKIALQSLHALERRLSKDPELAKDFSNQIKEMVQRGAAAVLAKEEVSSWEGDYYYLPMVGVKGKKKWLRVCFDASRRQGGGPSMNDCLFKGPDRFINDLLSVVIGFRNGRVGCAADLSKFHNQVLLTTPDTHMQRFLWRDCDTNREPETYVVKVNNFGVRSANCIATCALHKSADVFAGIPRKVEQ